MAQFTELMTEIVGKALAANNEELGQSISEDRGKTGDQGDELPHAGAGGSRGGPLPQAGCCDPWKYPQKDEQKEKKLWKKKSRHKRDGFWLCTKD